jgi:hypothetical protein
LVIAVLIITDRFLNRWEAEQMDRLKQQVQHLQDQLAHAHHGKDARHKSDQEEGPQARLQAQDQQEARHKSKQEEGLRLQAQAQDQQDERDQVFMEAQRESDQINHSLRQQVQV